MSCGPQPVIFRLLDSFVGWDVADASGLAIDDEPGGLHLQSLAPGSLSPGALLPYLPPARLVPGCDPCSWYLVGDDGRLLHRDGCSTGCFEPVAGIGPLLDPVAVAHRRHRLAIADRAGDRVTLWTDNGRLAGVISIEAPGPLAFTPWGELLVASAGAIGRYDLSGLPLGNLAASPPGEIERIAAGDDCALWIATRDGRGLRLWRAPRGAAAFEPAAPGDLAATFPPTSLIAAAAAGFCLEELRPSGLRETTCYDWGGCPLPPGTVAPDAPAAWTSRGQLLTAAIDSGIPRCRWHRVRLDAEIPSRTSVEIAIATSELANPASQGAVDPGWPGFPAGLPHPDDWQVAPPGATDFLVQQPPGRYLFARVRLTTDDPAVTPTVRRIRLDMPRSTSLEHLPAVYRDSPEAEDFSERFLALFDASIEDIDRAIERFPAMLDAAGVPEEALGWLGRFLDLAFDPSWPIETRRRLLAAAPSLYPKRGTRAGLHEAIELITGAAAAISEPALERSWAVLGGARVRGARLYGRSRARLRLGGSPLGAAPLRQHGNPDLDPLADTAYRIQVQVPPDGGDPADLRRRVERLVESQKPAHAVATVHVGGDGFFVGSRSALGIDTLMTGLPAPVLGVNTRLRRRTILWPGPRSRGSRFAVGQTAAVGHDTTIL